MKIHVSNELFSFDVLIKEIREVGEKCLSDKSSE